MNTKAWKLATFAAILSAVSASVWAHHSVSGRHESTPVTLSGTVVEFRLVNPHSAIVFEAPSGDGKLVRWEAAFGAVNVMVRNFACSRDMLKAGDKVTLIGYREIGGEQRMDLGFSAVVRPNQGVMYLTESKRLLFRTPEAVLPPGVADVDFPMELRPVLSPAALRRLERLKATER